MKKIIRINILFLSTILLGLSSCNDDFLNVDPLDKYSDAAVWTDPALVSAYVNNIYLGQYYGYHTLMLSSLCDESMEVWAWETERILNSEISPSYVGALAPNFWIIAFRNLSWNSLYRNIRSCNAFFENVVKYELEGDEIERLKGEVHYLRGYFYYWLMSMHGGVPLIDKSYTTSDDLLVARNTLAETIDFIVADLDEAARILPTSGDKARASKGAALALKSRVLLHAASDLFNSNASWSSGYANPELVSYIGGDRRARWQAARDAAAAVMNLGVYELYGQTTYTDSQAAADNYANIFLNHGTNEDIMVTYYDYVNHGSGDFQQPRVGMYNSPNGFHGWGGNTPIGQYIDAYENADGSKFDWNTQKDNPYVGRDPRFYANILYDGAHWRQRPDDVIGSDPDGIVQTGRYETATGSYTPGLDTRQGPIEDWNGSYTGYYMRKFIDPAVNHQYEIQPYPFRQMRYAEIILNYVEASLELGDEAEARAKLNQIRERAGMPPISDSETGTVLRDRYRNERRIELCYEGHRFFDIRRWMIAPDVMKPAQGIDIRYPYGSTQPVYTVTEVQGRAWNNKAYLLPILLDEMNKNELLIQNPGY
jgi:hypothetical protein